MPDIFLYPGEGVQNDVKLRDPTVLATPSASITLSSSIALQVNDPRQPWLTEGTSEPWLTELTAQPWTVEADTVFHVFQVSNIVVSPHYAALMSQWYAAA